MVERLSGRISEGLATTRLDSSKRVEKTMIVDAGMLRCPMGMVLV